MQRCYNPKNNRFQDWGGRGISVHPSWHDFANFLKDNGECPPGLRIDRIDNDGNYEPGNTRWATLKEQANNSRSNRRITIGSETKTIAQWRDAKGISKETADRRLYILGWSPEEALARPVRPRRK
jgi:hypothetical protein